MRTQPVAEEDRAAAVNPSVLPWQVVAVEALHDYRLKVRFVDDSEGLIEMKAFIHSPRAGVFAVLADPGKFSKVYLENDTVTWPGELDLAPDAMHRAIQETGCWDLSRRSEY